MSTQPAVVQKPDATVIMDGRVPAGAYTCRFTFGKLTDSKKGFKQINARAEVIKPDRVQLHDGTWVGNIGGAKFDVYITVDEGSSQYQAWYSALARLKLLDGDRNINIPEVIEAMKSGKVFFFATLDSEEQVKRYPAKPGQSIGDPIKHPVTGVDLKGGWRVGYVGPDSIIERTEVNLNEPIVAAQVTNRPY